ncbi:hypothetical protein [Hyphococcus sp.]|uniref:hypothetical protein n=1 Tax=Hyphococcus sp. TaxID=2038636 RepID=UPI0035C78012
MWLIAKNNRRPGPNAPPIDPSASSALRAAFTGAADDQDIDLALGLFRKAHRHGLWIACDCRAHEKVYPLSAPAYLTTSGTYFLRRLTGGSRPNHAQTCPFQFERPLRGISAKRLGALAPIKSPTGLFSVLTPERRAHLSDFPLSAHALSAKGPPKLARQLWRLLAMARLNRQGPVQRAPKPSIKLEFASLRDVAERLEVHPGTALARVLATHPDDYHSKRLFARIRAAKKQWAAESPLQGFLLLYTRDIKAKTLVFDHADSIHIEGDLLRPSAGPLAGRGPYLTLAVIGDHGGESGLAVLRAWAQPVYSGGQFTPVSGGVERAVLKAINSARWRLARSHPHLEISVEKPLFDMETQDRPVRPDFIVECVNARTGEIDTRILEIMDPDAVADLDAKADAQTAMGIIGRVEQIEADALVNGPALSGRVAAALRFE